MKCPVDGTWLVITDRSGVELDYCPQCRGVWLDRGELDMAIDRSGTAMQPAPQPRGDHGGGYRKKMRGGFLDEMFDF